MGHPVLVLSDTVEVVVEAGGQHQLLQAFHLDLHVGELALEQGVLVEEEVELPVGGVLLGFLLLAVPATEKE